MVLKAQILQMDLLLDMIYKRLIILKILHVGSIKMEYYNFWLYSQKKEKLQHLEIKEIHNKIIHLD